jgi:hypothetical protein
LPVFAIRDPKFDAAVTQSETGIGDPFLAQDSKNVIAQLRHHGFAQRIGVDFEQDARSAQLLHRLLGTGRNRRAHLLNNLRVVSRRQIRRGDHRQQGGGGEESQDTEPAGVGRGKCHISSGRYCVGGDGADSSKRSTLPFVAR